MGGNDNTLSIYKENLLFKAVPFQGPLYCAIIIDKTMFIGSERKVFIFDLKDNITSTKIFDTQEKIKKLAQYKE